jgi:tetratricopeptide (TPR) repeat protein
MPEGGPAGGDEPEGDAHPGNGFRFDDLFDGEVFRRLKIEVDPDRVEESVERLTAQVRRAVVRGRYTRVRILYRGKPLMRDLPLGVFVAAEAMSFWYAGLLRALVVNLGARAVLEVVFIMEADEDVRRGREAVDAGEVLEAEDAFRAALEKEPSHQEALFRLGVLLRMTGKREEALERLEAAAALEGPLQEQAREVLARMRRGPRTL